MKEVKRPAKVGEYIKIVDSNDIVCNGYKNGDIFKIVKVDGFGAVSGVSETYVNDDIGWCFYDEEYVVLEDYNPDEAKQTTIVVDKINTVISDDEIYKYFHGGLHNPMLDDNTLDSVRTAINLCKQYDKLINEEREEKDMNKVLKLYEERKLKEIDEKYEKKVEDDYNEIELVKQYNDLVNNFENKLEELFTSLDNFDNGYLVTQCDSNCYKYALSEGMIKNNIMDKYAEEKIADKLELDNLIGEVDAQLSLSDDLTYQLEVLNRYGIIDKKTNKMTV